MWKCWWKMIKSSRSEAKTGRITIGRVGAPHGIKGEVRILPLTDFVERFEGMTEVMVGDELLAIDSVRFHNARILMKFAAYATRERAGLLTGKLLTVKKEEAAPLKDGEFYTFDIIGLEVFSPGGKSLGRVQNVLRTGSNDVYEAFSEGKSILIPALKSVVKEIDIKGGRMIVDMPEEIQDMSEAPKNAH